MNRRAFTLIELLVVIAIIAILAAILFPVFAQAKEKARQTTSLNNHKQIATAFQLYLSDHDDHWPLAYGDWGGRYRYNYYHAVPAGWRPAHGPGTERYDAYTKHWSNSIQKYIQNYPIYENPSGHEIQLVSEVPDPGDPRPRLVSYTYNGLLHRFNSAGIVSPAELIATWDGRGKASILGFALSSPALRCIDLDEVCIYVPGGPPRGVMFSVSGTMWIHNGGMQASFADTHAKWRRVGAQIVPARTDWRVDPFSRYRDTGFPTHYWWDGAHAWLFRPGYDFSD